jgi:S-adenosylmethionine/arginine decarboxylase-like enzyme
MEVITGLVHQFGSQGRGVTGVFVVAESHLIIHTWPESNSVNLDIFFCNFTKNNERKAQQVLARLVKLYRPTRIIKKVIRHRL